MAQPRVLLFDLDGVLVRSEDAWFEVVQAAVGRFGKTLRREDFDASFGQGTHADVAQYGLPCSIDELDRLYLDEFPRHTAAVRVDPEARPLLDTLRRRGLRCAVVTNTVSPLARIILRGGGLDAGFEAIAGADEVAHAKPAPDLLQLALQRLGAGPEEAWMIGDSRFDREAAAAAGVRFVGLRLDGDLRIERLGALDGLLDAEPAAAS